MISYYRIYYDQQIQAAVNNGVKLIYIHKPLPTYEITQEELANFINSNEKDVSFKCELNRYIYAIARYLPQKYETKIPIEKQCLYDVFIFPTPTKNKNPSYVTPLSIKTAQAFVLRQKIDAFDTVTATIVDKVLTPISADQNGVVHWYKKTKMGLLKTKKTTDSGQVDYGSEWAQYSKYYTPSSMDLHRLVVERLCLKNVFQTQKYIQINYSINPQLRTVSTNDQNSASEDQRVVMRSDFTSFPKITVLDMINPGKHSYFNPWLKAQWSSTRYDSSTFRHKMTWYMDAQIVKSDFQNYYWNFHVFMDNWAIKYQGESPYSTDITMFNLLSASDMSLLPQEYINDTSYYSILHNFFSFEFESPMHSADYSVYTWSRNQYWTSPDTTLITVPERADATTFWFKYLQQYNPTWMDNTNNVLTIGGKDFCFRNKFMRGRLERDNKFLPIQTKSYVVRDKSNLKYDPHGYHVVYTIRVIKKESIDWLLDNSFQMNTHWFVDHITDLTNIKYDQYWFTYSFILGASNTITSLTRTNFFSVHDQTMFSYKDDLTSYSMNHWRIMYNYNENTDKWNLVHGSDTWDWTRGDHTNLSNKQQMSIWSRQTRNLRVVDSTLNTLADFTLASTSPQLNARAFTYTVANSVVNSTEIVDVCSHWTEDLKWWAGMDFMIGHLLGFEDGIIVNEVRKKSNTEFLFRDLVTNPFISGYTQNALIQNLNVHTAWYGVKTNENITTTLSDAKLYKQQIYNSSPSEQYDTRPPYYDRSNYKYHTQYFYRNGSSSTTSFTKYYYWDSEYQQDHYDGMNGYYTYLFDATSYPYSDITAQSSPSAMFYIAKPGKGGVAAEYGLSSVTIYDYQLGSNLPFKWTFGHIRAQSDASDWGKRVDSCYTYGQFIQTKNIDSIDIYSKVMEAIMRMTPHDLLITNSLSPSGSRVLTNLWPYHRADDTIEYTLDWIDTSICIPQTIIISERVSRKQNWVLTSNTATEIQRRYQYTLGWCMKVPKPLYWCYGISFNWYTNNMHQFLRSFQLDRTTDIVFIEWDNLNNYKYNSSDYDMMYVNYTSTSQSNYGNFIRRTPTLHMIGRDHTYSYVRQNAVIDLMYFHISAFKNGYILPKRELSSTVYDLTTLISRDIPYWNYAKDITPNDTTVRINVYDNQLLAGDLTEHETLFIDTKMINRWEPANESYRFTRDIGYPYIAVNSSALVPQDNSYSLSIQQLLDTTGYQHVHYLDIESIATSNDLLVKNVDHTVDMEFDFQDGTFSVYKKDVPKSIFTDTIFTDYNTMNPFMWVYPDWTNWYTMNAASLSQPLYYWSFKNHTTNNQSNIYEICDLKFDDYTFENKTYAANTDQSSKYSMSRIQVNSSNIIMNTELSSAFHSPTPYWSDFTTNILSLPRYSVPQTKGELLYLMQTFDNNSTFIMRLKLNWILIDGTNRDKMYVAFCDGVLINVGSFLIADWDKVLPIQAWASNQFFNDIWIVPSNTVSVMNFLNKLKTTEFSPSGNMYMISDYDNDFMELVYNDILSLLI